MIHVDGSTLQGIGAIAGVVIVAWGAFRKQRLFHFLRDRVILVGEREYYERRWKEAEARATSAETSSRNWEGAAKGAAFDHELLLERIGELETKVALVEPLAAKFNALVDYTHEVIEYAVAIEHAARAAGASLDNLLLPAPPAILADKVMLPVRHAVRDC